MGPEGEPEEWCPLFLARTLLAKVQQQQRGFTRIFEVGIRID